MENKLATLLDLLRAFEAAAPLSLVACCGARDSLDALVAAAVGVQHCRVWVLHADMSEREVEATVRDYRAATQPDLAAEQQQAEQQEQQAGGEGAGQAGEAGGRRRRGAGDASPRQGEQAAAEPPFVAVLATTDAGLRAVPKDLLPLSPTLLISYDLPPRKELYLRRIQSVLGSRASAARGCRRIAVNFAVAGQLEEFRQVEEWAEKPIEGMPVHVADIFAGA
ncbi:eukaryotic initiation factor 4A [Chlorella sorokiniana]|uniref:Eukaryotic initiation factor 4A n=1 Tax=Chlorella sorokiniana TaxID=3076 RepID=A0A2P6TM82_CHLSO|nr:eukaryotic initiation factor 4A [Chlorella sorokiniana]|eukprot:PRW45444.1 eukaryotic initiation factor 4A [Chlorella sorokiniana]